MLQVDPKLRAGICEVEATPVDHPTGQYRLLQFRRRAPKLPVRWQSAAASWMQEQQHWLQLPPRCQSENSHSSAQPVSYRIWFHNQRPVSLHAQLHRAGSPADLAALRPGDALLGVNGVSVRGLAHDDVAAAIARCGGLLTLIVAPSHIITLCTAGESNASAAASTAAASTAAAASPRMATSDPRIIGPEVRYEQVPRHRHQKQQQAQHQLRHRRSKQRRRVICRHKFVLSYIGSLSIPPVSCQASATRTVASAVARLKSEARAVTLATLDIDEELALDAESCGINKNEDYDDDDDNENCLVSISLTSCTGRCLFRLSATDSQQQQLLLAGRHSQDAAYFGLLTGCSSGASALTVHGFYANPQLAASHAAHAQWAAAFGIVCSAVGLSTSSTVTGCSCRSFPPDAGAVLTALRSLCAWRSVGSSRRQSATVMSSSSIATTTSSTASSTATFKVPMPPPPPPQQPTVPSQSPSFLRRFARGASGSFRKLRRRSTAMSTERIRARCRPATSAAAADPASIPDPTDQQNTSGRHPHLLNSSLASSERNLSSMGVEPEPESASSVAKWATGLPHLLADPAGVGVFTDFLRLEFSEENIAFWLAVEDYRLLTNAD
uniref:PDZ domain-containing protein n=1 Tax=Macrostomum lignano TaxID=282301 RepID=A0A1I8F6R9_9PLAT